MAVAGMKLGRNDPCPCGSGSKAKYCCSAPVDVADRDGSRFLAELSSRGQEELGKLCPDCQTEVWLDVLDLPDAEEACRLVVLAPRPASVLRLGAALRRGDTGAVADELPVALREIDRPSARASVADGVLEAEAAGRVRPAVAEAALADLAEGRPSLLLMAALLSGLAAEAGIRPARLGALKPLVRSGRLFEPQGRSTRCRRKPATSGRQ
jgi:hypothetical protein